MQRSSTRLFRRYSSLLPCLRPRFPAGGRASSAAVRKLCEKQQRCKFVAVFFPFNSSPPENKGRMRDVTPTLLLAQRFFSSPRTSLDSLQPGATRKEFLGAARRLVKDTKTASRVCWDLTGPPACWEVVGKLRVRTNETR